MVQVKRDNKCACKKVPCGWDISLVELVRSGLLMVVDEKRIREVHRDAEVHSLCVKDCHDGR